MPAVGRASVTVQDELSDRRFLAISGERSRPPRRDVDSSGRKCMSDRPRRVAQVPLVDGTTWRGFALNHPFGALDHLSKLEASAAAARFTLHPAHAAPHAIRILPPCMYRMAAAAPLYARPEIRPRTAVQGCVLRPLCAGDARRRPGPKETTVKCCRRSEPVWWAWLDLNQRPHPYQVSRAKRCAERRFPRSPLSVTGEGMRSNASTGNATKWRLR